MTPPASDRASAVVTVGSRRSQIKGRSFMPDGRATPVPGSFMGRPVVADTGVYIDWGGMKVGPVPGSPEDRVEELYRDFRENCADPLTGPYPDEVLAAIRDAVAAERGRCAGVAFRARAGLPAADPAVDLLCEIESDIRGGPS